MNWFFSYSCFPTSHNVSSIRELKITLQRQVLLPMLLTASGMWWQSDGLEISFLFMSIMYYNLKELLTMFVIFLVKIKIILRSHEIHQY